MTSLPSCVSGKSSSGSSDGDQRDNKRGVIPAWLYAVLVTNGLVVVVLLLLLKKSHCNELSSIPAMMPSQQALQNINDSATRRSSASVDSITVVPSSASLSRSSSSLSSGTVDLSPQRGLTAEYEALPPREANTEGPRPLTQHLSQDRLSFGTFCSSLQHRTVLEPERTVLQREQLPSSSGSFIPHCTRFPFFTTVNQPSQERSSLQSEHNLIPIGPPPSYYQAISNIDFTLEDENAPPPPYVVQYGEYV